MKKTEFLSILIMDAVCVVFGIIAFIISNKMARYFLFLIYLVLIVSAGIILHQRENSGSKK
jgi:hypothetical protein